MFCFITICFSIIVFLHTIMIYIINFQFVVSCRSCYPRLEKKHWSSQERKSSRIRLLHTKKLQLGEYTSLIYYIINLFVKIL